MQERNDGRKVRNYRVSFCHDYNHSCVIKGWPACPSTHLQDITTNLMRTYFAKLSFCVDAIIPKITFISLRFFQIDIESKQRYQETIEKYKNVAI